MWKFKNSFNIESFLILLILVPWKICKGRDYQKESIRLKLPFEALSKKPNNMVVSTLALRLPLCKLATVAEGETKRELMIALGLDSDSMAKTCFSELRETLSQLMEIDNIFLNKMYVSYTDPIDSSFITNSSEVFGVAVDKVGFDYPIYATSFINKWIDAASYKRITDLIGPNDITRDTSILLVSGLYFKVTWEFQFNIRFTKHYVFHRMDRNFSLTPMMVKTDSFMYYEDEINKFQAVDIKLGIQGVTITFILPRDKSALPELMKHMSNEPKMLKTIKEKMRYTYMRVILPRMKIKTLLDWTELVKQFSLNHTLNATSGGLNAILKKGSTAKNVYLSKVKQKVFFELDEMGTFRHIDGIDMPYLLTTQPPHFANMPDFRADRPFYFNINLLTGDDQQELFHGVYYGPEEK